MERAMKRFIITGFNRNDRLSGRDGRTQQGGTSAALQSNKSFSAVQQILLGSPTNPSRHLSISF
eukprot:scaffold16651_cov109-Skeletonema_dohrnii-CCMP3373.AAC.1